MTPTWAESTLIYTIRNNKETKATHRPVQRVKTQPGFCVACIPIFVSWNGRWGLGHDPSVSARCWSEWHADVPQPRQVGWSSSRGMSLLSSSFSHVTQGFRGAFGVRFRLRSPHRLFLPQFFIILLEASFFPRRRVSENLAHVVVRLVADGRAETKEAKASSIPWTWHPQHIRLPDVPFQKTQMRRGEAGMRELHEISTSMRLYGIGRTWSGLRINLEPH